MPSMPAMTLLNDPRSLLLPLLVAGLVYNAAVAAVYALDKYRAARGGRRVSEKTLLTLALTMGAPGALLAMRVARHKTRKPRFYITVPLLAALQVAAVSVGAWAAVWR